MAERGGEEKKKREKERRRRGEIIRFITNTTSHERYIVGARKNDQAVFRDVVIFWPKACRARSSSRSPSSPFFPAPPGASSTAGAPLPLRARLFFRFLLLLLCRRCRVGRGFRRRLCFDLLPLLLLRLSFRSVTQSGMHALHCSRCATIHSLEPTSYTRRPGSAHPLAFTFPDFPQIGHAI